MRRSSSAAYWTPAVALIVWFSVLTLAVALLWARHIGNPPDDVDLVPLSSPAAASITWLVAFTMIVTGLRLTRR